MKGAWGEKAARLYLEKRGWHTAATNFRTRFGEIDIIAENAQYVIFAEVKTRKNARYGLACEAVTPAKQAKIIAAAQAWLQEHPTEKQLINTDKIIRPAYRCVQPAEPYISLKER